MRYRIRQRQQAQQQQAQAAALVGVLLAPVALALFCALLWILQQAITAALHVR